MAKSEKLSHIDAHWDHADQGQHYDITKGSTQAIHVDVGHVDMGHLDVGHMDVGHLDLGHADLGGHVDIGGHFDIGHFDFGHFDVGHLDFGHLDLFHIDVHVDITKGPEPDDEDPIELFVSRVNNLIVQTESQVMGIDKERKQLESQLQDFRKQLEKALRDK